MGHCQICNEVVTNQIQITRTNDQEIVSGYLAVWYDGSPESEYQISDRLVERLDSHCFDNALRNTESIPLYYNHNRHDVICTTDDALMIRADNKGLKFSYVHDDKDPVHQKAKIKIQKGIVRGCSFAGDGTYKQEYGNKQIIRTITEMTYLAEFSVVHNPAYVGTSAVVRDEIEDEIRRWERTQELIKKYRGING